MLKNYLKIAFRNLRRQVGFAFINIFGLTIGLACFILICLFVQHERSYDSFHDKSERIYRIVEEDPTGFYLGSNLYTDTPAPLLNALLDEFPEVEHVTQLQKVRALLNTEQKGLYRDGIYASDQFFDVFTFPFAHGNPRTALSEPNTIVLTESMAQTLFGDTDPLGHSVSVLPSVPWWLTPPSSGTSMSVVGVVEDVPTNSHFSFDYLISLSSSGEYIEDLDQWDNSNYFTYASLHPGQSIEAFESKLAVLARTNLRQNEYYQNNPDEITTHLTQALTDIHLRSQINGEFGPNGDIKYVYFFSLIAFLILFIASINYINLTAARATSRIKEVGVRKSMGARRSQLIGQFMGEATVPTVLGMVGALMLAILLLPSFNAMMGRTIAIDLSNNGVLLGGLILFGLGVGILSGSYPAISLSARHPVKMMNGVMRRNMSMHASRNVLVVTQFAIGIALIIGTLVMREQLDFMQSAHTGIDRNHVISIEVKDPELRSRFSTLEQSLSSHPGVVAVTASHHNPIYIDAQSSTRAWEGSLEGQSISAYHTSVHHNYVDLFNVELTEGGEINRTHYPDERVGMLINETLKRQLGWDTALGKWIELNGRKGRVVGVMKDFNFQSFHQPVEPLALYLDSSDYSRVLVKAQPQDLQGTLSFLEMKMVELSPAFPFEYVLLDGAYDRLYERENMIGSIFSFFTVLALAIACLGLFGLAAFIASKRRKEMGVRKVLGASTSEILIMLSRECTRLVGFAFLLSAPLAYFIMRGWLQGFAYRTTIGWKIFALAGGLALVLALLTVSYQTIKVAIKNPVESLRYE